MPPQTAAPDPVAALLGDRSSRMLAGGELVGAVSGAEAALARMLEGPGGAP